MSQNNSGPDAQKITFALIPPAIVSTIVAVTDVVTNWHIDWYGIAILCGFAVLASALQLFPQRWKKWVPPIGSSLLALRQTLGTMRVLISIVLVIGPLLVLGTNQKVVENLPAWVSKYIERFADQRDEKVHVWVFVPKESAVTFEPSIYAGRFKTRATSASATPIVSGAASGELYVLQFKSILGKVAEDQVSLIRAFAVFLLVLCFIFVLASSIMDMLGDVSWTALQPARKRTRKKRY
jgi:hypothetical protein